MVVSGNPREISGQAGLAGNGIGFINRKEDATLIFHLLPSTDMDRISAQIPLS